MSPQVYVFSSGEQSRAAEELEKLEIPYTRTSNILKDILMSVDPICAVFEGADPHLVEFCRFLTQSNTSSVVVDPKTPVELQYAHDALLKNFEPWVLDKLRGCDYDVAKYVQTTPVVELTDIVSEARYQELLDEPTLRGVDFNVCQYSANDLVILGAILFRHAIKRVNVDIDFDRIVYLMLVLRSCYGVRGYHCYRHVIDVAQYIYFLQLNGLCYHDTDEPLSGLDACTLILCALGHDLLHPNVTTPTVVRASPEWANKFECLEKFHYTVYMSVLRPLAPEVVQVDGLVEQLQMLTFATEMRLHLSYLERPITTDGSDKGRTADSDKAHANVTTTDDARANFLCLVMKLADICNCSRLADSSIRQTISLGMEIAGEVKVRDHLQLSPGQHSASKPTTNFGTTTREIWKRIQQDQGGFSKAFFLPIWEKLHDTTSATNRRLLETIKVQFDGTTAIYLCDDVPQGYSFDQLFID